MRILVVDHNRAERDTTQRLLPADSHDVKTAPDAATALQALEAHAFDVVLVESTMTGVTGNELVKRIRAGESSGHVYLVVTAAHSVAGDVKAAFSAGADDFIRKPMNRDELLARVDGPARIRRWAPKVLVGAVASAHAGLTDIAAWTTLEGSVSADLSDMLGLTMTPVPTNRALDGAKFIATMPLTIPTEMTELRLAVGIDDASAKILAETMFGSPDAAPEMVRDMIREIANVAAGAFKRMAASEGYVFTTGLPNEMEAEAFRSASPVARKQWVGTVEGSPMKLSFEVELRIREPLRVRPSALKEGMVVAVDVRSPNGCLLVRAGTRITESHLDGLCNVLGRESSIEIVEAA